MALRQEYQADVLCELAPQLVFQLLVGLRNQAVRKLGLTV